jgi:cytochrome P450
MAEDASRSVDPYAQLRAECGNQRVLLNDSGPYGESSSAMVVGYEEAATVLRDWHVFSSEVHAYQDDFRGVTIRQMDGEPHQRHRALVSHAFRPSAVQRWEREAVRPVIDALLDAGQVTMEDGSPTGARPGRLVRGHR